MLKETACSKKCVEMTKSATIKEKLKDAALEQTRYNTIQYNIEFVTRHM